jgi:hypothetical protein
MKPYLYVSLLTLSLGLCAQESSNSNLAARRGGEDAFAGPIGPHHRRLGEAAAMTRSGGTQGQRALAAARGEGGGVVEIATGMNYWDGQAYVPSDARFEVTPEAFAAERVGHKVWLRANLNVAGAVTMVTPDGQLLRSTPVALGLYDAASGRSAIIGTIQDCEGVQVSDTEVVYENAFQGDGILADVVYSISKGMFEQDVVIRGRLDPRAWGFPAESSRIQVTTEFYEAPKPEKMRRPLRVEEDEKVRRRMVSPDFVDEVLSFGEVTMWTGTAYTAASGKGQGGVPVAKEWVKGERTFLVESMEYGDMASALEALPEVNAAGLFGRTPGKNRASYAMIPRPPSIAEARAATPRRETVLAQAAANLRRSVVIDYIVVPGYPEANYVFRAGTTYHVTGSVWCGPVTLEGGTVVKYAPGQWIQLNGAVTCTASATRPALFTAEDDNAEDAGQAIDGHGSPLVPATTGYANPALRFYELAALPSHLRIRYAQVGIQVYRTPGGSATIAHAQLIKCIKGIALIGCSTGSCGVTVTVNNTLFAKVNKPLTASVPYGAAVNLSNCTVDNTAWSPTEPCYVLTREVPPGTSSGYTAAANIQNTILAHVSGFTANGATLSGNYNGSYQSPALGNPSWSVGTSPFADESGGDYHLHPTTGSAFLDKGSQRADQAGLYHFTTGLDNVKEQTTKVDLGYHYAAHGSATTTPQETVWVDDELPLSNPPSWAWVTANPLPQSGMKSHAQIVTPGETHRREFTSAQPALAVTSSSALFAYVYLDAANPTTEIMLEWYDGSSWAHRAYWSNSPRTPRDQPGDFCAGPLPPKGQWIRLEVAARYVGFTQNTSLTGMAFKHVGGKVAWDRAGRAAAFALDSDGDGYPDHVEDRNGNGTSTLTSGTLETGESPWASPNQGFMSRPVINVNFGGGAKAGPAAVGYASDDFWNACGTTANQLALKAADGTFTPVQITVNTLATASTGTDSHSDLMFGTFIKSTQYIDVTLSGLTPGTYCLYLYGHGPNNQDNSCFSVTTVDSGTSATTGTYDYKPGTANTPKNNSTGNNNWNAGFNYCLGWSGGSVYGNYLVYTIAIRPRPVGAIENIKIRVTPGATTSSGTSGGAFLNGLQIGRQTRGLYISEKNLSVTNPRIGDVLNFIRNNQFNYITLYGFDSYYGDSGWTGTEIATFITQARTQCGVLQVGAAAGVLELNTAGTDFDYTKGAGRIADYDWAHPEAPIDVINMERGHGYYKWVSGAETWVNEDQGREFWNIGPCAGHDWSTTYWSDTIPAPASNCGNYRRRADAFDQEYNITLQEMRQLAGQLNLQLEAYIGYPTKKRNIYVDEWANILSQVDRLLVHAYHTTPDYAYNSLNWWDKYRPETAPYHPRMEDLANTEATLSLPKKTMMWPIFSAEAEFMGPWLNKSNASAAEQIVSGKPVWDGVTNPLELSGYQYFCSPQVIPWIR